MSWILEIYFDPKLLAEQALTGYEHVSGERVAGRVVYVIVKERGLIKIGISSHPRHRIHSIIKTAGVVPLCVMTTPTILNASRVETQFKRHHKQYQVNGEWYGVPEVEAIVYLQNSCDLEFDSKELAEGRGQAERKRQHGVETFTKMMFARRQTIPAPHAALPAGA
jgi:hypothetical protein